MVATQRKSVFPEGKVEALTEAIRNFGPAYAVAQVCDCHLDTAKSYQRGHTVPDIMSLARLMAASRQVTDAFLKMAGLDELSLDLEEARLRDELARLLASRAGKTDARKKALAELARKMVDEGG